MQYWELRHRPKDCMRSNQKNKTEKNRVAQLEASAWWEPKYIYSMFPDPPQQHLFTIIFVLIPNTNLLSLPQPLLPLTPQVLNYKNNTQRSVKKWRRAVHMLFGKSEYLHVNVYELYLFALKILQADEQFFSCIPFKQRHKMVNCAWPSICKKLFFSF